MSTFEFVLIAIAIVVGFGISEILAGWGRQLRLRNEMDLCPLQLVASAYILALSLRYMWLQWALRSADWDYAGYLLTAAPAVVLALAAQVTKVDLAREGRGTAESQYFESRRPLYALVALFYLSVFLRGTYMPIQGDPWRFFVAISLLVFVVCGWLALSETKAHHWIGLSLLWVAQLAFAITFLRQLVGAAA